MFDVAVEDVGERPEKLRSAGDEPQQLGDADTGQLAVERAVSRLLRARVDQLPALFVGPSGDLDVPVGVLLDVSFSMSYCVI
jgi:hypothetical protein